MPLLARGSRTAELIIGWSAGALTPVAFYIDAITPHDGLAGRVAIVLAMVAAAVYLGRKNDRSAATLADCVDKTIGSAVRFGREAERRRLDDRAGMATVHEFNPPRNRGGNR